jgi:hypothetical protein
LASTFPLQFADLLVGLGVCEIGGVEVLLVEDELVAVDVGVEDELSGAGRWCFVVLF